MCLEVFFQKLLSIALTERTMVGAKKVVALSNKAILLMAPIAKRLVRRTPAPA